MPKGCGGYTPYKGSFNTLERELFSFMLQHLHIQVPQATIIHKCSSMKTLCIHVYSRICAFWELNPDPPSSSHTFYSLIKPINLLKEQFTVLFSCYITPNIQTNEKLPHKNDMEHNQERKAHDV